ncbi:hypothetical protein [Lacipirellula parvula]|uniref:hypothetical protein n=1 Tax=Lacipirellula parvula TaxID=2650471 RepID=UPI001561FDFE|nr:hypothetical protein [Lacipirellula parvula]
MAGDPLWIALDGSDAAVDYAIRFEPRGVWIWYLTDLAAVRVIATPGNSAKIGVTWLR